MIHKNFGSSSGAITVSLLLAFLALLVVGGISCGKIQNISAPKRDLVAQEIKYFAPSEIPLELSKNTIFFWKKDFTGNQVSSVLKYAKLVERIDDALDPLRSEQGQLKIKEKNLRLEKNKINTSFNKTQKDLDQKEAELKKLESAVPRPDEVTLQKLRNEIEILKKEKVLKEEQKAKAEKDLSELSKKLEALNVRINAFTLPGTPITASAATELLSQQVDRFQAPSLFRFEFLENTGIAVSIEGWNLGDEEVAPSLSSLEGTIQNVKYEPLGGVFTFEIPLAHETFYVRVVRTKYERAENVFFSGDIVHKRSAQYCELKGLPMVECEPRYGVVKLSDRIPQ